MQHVLITKFAMRFAPENPRRRYERPDWIDYRMGLFEKYCAPSVMQQSYKKFDWWIVIDPSFPELTDQHIDRLRSYGRILNVSAYWDEKQPEIGAALSSHYSKEWVCSTRLDSDDMLRKDFMHKLSRHTDRREQFISFRNGYMIKGDKIMPRQYEVNPFMSYIEYADPLKTVFHVSHIHADRQKIPFTVVDDPVWAQVDHGDNIKNHVSVKLKNFDENAVPLATVKGFPCT